MSQLIRTKPLLTALGLRSVTLARSSSGIPAAT